MNIFGKVDGVVESLCQQDGEKKAFSWKQEFEVRWKLPRWDVNHKQESIEVKDNHFTAATAKKGLVGDRCIRINKPYNSVGSYYIELLVTRGKFHTLFGVCDQETSDGIFHEHHRPWNPLGTYGVGSCWASDGEYYGTHCVETSGPNSLLRTWSTGDAVGMMTTIEKIEDGHITKFSVEFYLNGEAVGGVKEFSGKFGPSLWATACFYGAGEALTILPKHCPHTKIEDEEIVKFCSISTETCPVNCQSRGRTRDLLKKVGGSFGKFPRKFKELVKL